MFILSQTLSLLGSSLVQYAIMWYITLNTKSGVMMTISILCGFLPTLFLSPFAGVWADRYNRKLLIILSDSFIATATLLLAVLFLTGHGSMTLLFVMSALRAFGSGIQTPAVGAFLPQIVPEEHLTRVNGINGSIQAAIMIVSPMLSGFLLSFTKIEMIFFVDVITAAIAVAVLLFFLNTPAHAKAQSKEQISYYKDMADGVSYIRSHSYVKQFFLFCALFFFLISPAAILTPLQVTRTFGGDVWRLTAIEVAFSLGMLFGGALIAAWGGFKNRLHTMILACFGFSITTILLGVVPIFWIYLTIMGITGLSMPIFNTPSTVLLQEKVDPDFLGRVFGVMSMISTSMMPLGMLVFGPLADMVRIEWLLVATGFLMLLLTFFLIGNKVLIEAGKPKTDNTPQPAQTP